MERRRLKHFVNPKPLTQAGNIDFEFSFAFQPIVDVRNQEIISFEALVRGPNGEPAASVLSRVSDECIPSFDEKCRWKAIEFASRNCIPKKLNINLSAKSLHELDLNITATFKASQWNNFPVENIIFEILESACLTDHRNLLSNLKILQDFGFKTAIDDFGMGYSGIRLLLQYRPNYVKLDRYLISDIQWNEVKQCIFRGIYQMCEELSIDLIAEGVETFEEYSWLRSMGVNYFQGYYFAYPAFETFPEVSPQAYYV